MDAILPHTPIETKLVNIAKKCGFEVDCVEYVPSLKSAVISLKRYSKISFDALDMLSRSFNTRTIEVGPEPAHCANIVVIFVSNLDLNYISTLKGI